MTLHLQECLDLADGQILPVTQSDQLVEGAEEFVGISEDLALVQALASASNDLGEKVKRVDILENVGLLVGDEHHVKLIQGLIDKSNIVLLDGSVLCSGVGGLGEGGEKGFDARPLHVMKGPS